MRFRGRPHSHKIPRTFRDTRNWFRCSYFVTALGDRAAFSFKTLSMYTASDAKRAWFLDYFERDGKREKRGTIKEGALTAAIRVEGEIPRKQMPTSMYLVSGIYIQPDLLARSNLIPRVGGVFMAVFIARRQWNTGLYNKQAQHRRTM